MKVKTLVGINTYSVIGVDPSLSHTAVHVCLDYVPGHAVVSRAFSIKGELKKHPSALARLAYMRSTLAVELRSSTVAVSSQPVVVIENYSFGSKFAREQMGELGGAYRLAAYDAGLQVILVPPTSLKKFVTGKGVAEKDGMRMHCLKRFGYESTGNDDADAYCLMRLGLEYLMWKAGALTCVPKVTVESFQKLEVISPGVAKVA